MFTVEVSCSCVLDCIHECKWSQTLETPVSIIQSTAAALGFTVIHVLAKSGLHSEAGGDIIGESKLICLKRIFYKHFNLSQKSKVRPNCVCVYLCECFELWKQSQCSDCVLHAQKACLTQNDISHEGQASTLKCHICSDTMRTRWRLCMLSTVRLDFSFAAQSQ